MVIRPGFLATRFVFTAGIIGLLKPGRCLRPWNKSNFLDVAATVHPEKDSANNQTFHAGLAQNELSVTRNIKPVGAPTSPLPSGHRVTCDHFRRARNSIAREDVWIDASLASCRARRPSARSWRSPKPRWARDYGGYVSRVSPQQDRPRLYNHSSTPEIALYSEEIAKPLGFPSAGGVLVLDAIPRPSQL